MTKVVSGWRPGRGSTWNKNSVVRPEINSPFCTTPNNSNQRIPEPSISCVDSSGSETMYVPPKDQPPPCAARNLLRVADHASLLLLGGVRRCQGPLGRIFEAGDEKLLKLASVPLQPRRDGRISTNHGICVVIFKVWSTSKYQ